MNELFGLTEALRVLVVDDEEPIRRNFKIYLEDLGHEVTLAAEGDQALSIIRQQSFDIVLTDLRMAQLGGLKFIEKMRGICPDTPVIVVSGSGELKDAIEAVRLGAWDYVIKPIDDPCEISSAIERAMRRAKALEESRRRQERLEEQVQTRTRELMDVISEGKRTEEMLRKSEQRLGLALEGGGMGMWEWDLRMNRSFWNAREYELLGLPAGDGEVPTDLFFQHVYPEDRAGLERGLDDVLERGDQWTAEFRIVRMDGEKRFLAAAARLFRDATGRPLRMIGVNYDITDRKRAEEALQKAIRSAEQARSAAERASHAKDEFLAVLSHELRTPLSPILAAAQLMKCKKDLSKDTLEYVDIILRNLQLEARLIDDLLDLTRIVRGKLELKEKPINISAAIEHVINQCRQDIDARRLHCGLDVEELSYWVSGDDCRLEQVLWNLLKNSIKFTPEGGCIGVRCYRDGTMVVIEVTDTGIGIEKDILPRLFNAFEQGDRRTTRQFGGLGLGLAISKRLVELHGGTICARSPGKGQGATFCVALPLLLQKQGGDVIDEAAAASGLRPPRRILLVEDHGDTALMMKGLLEASGYEVETAGDVKQALGAVVSKPFDLLISDLGLPDRSGLDLMKELRERGSDLKGIALSGFGREEDVRKSKEAGFSKHLTKPMDVDTLIGTIEALF